MSKAPTVIIGSWSTPRKLPDGKRGSLLMLAPHVFGTPDSPFKATAKSGVITTGTLTDLVNTKDGVQYWTVTRDKKTPEQQAADQALRASSTAAFWTSEKGVETAAKRQAAMAKRETEAVTPEVVTTTATTAATTAPTMDLATMIASFIASGMDATTAATTAMAVINVPKVTTAPAVKAPAVKAPVVKATTDTRKPCDSCGKRDQLVTHKAAAAKMGHAVHVCSSCVTSDGETVAARVARKAGKA